MQGIDCGKKSRKVEKITKEQAQFVNPQDLELITSEWNVPNGTRLKAQQVQEAQYGRKTNNPWRSLPLKTGRKRAPSNRTNAGCTLPLIIVLFTHEYFSHLFSSQY